MGKWSKYEKKYNPDWEKDPLFKEWIQKTSLVLINEGKSEAYCKLCRSTIRPQKNDLLQHKLTSKHKQAEKVIINIQKNPKLENFGYEGSAKNTKEKIMDLKISVLVACHGATSSVDHIGELLRVLGKGSHLENLRLHRTKCSRIIENVITPSLLKGLVEDVGNNFYSIICDEATDITSMKMFALCVRYYSFNNRKMVTAYLGILETPKATAEILYETFVKFILKIGLSLDKLLAFGTDGGSNLCGKHHSLYALLKKKNCPHLKLVRCLCHSLDTCSSNASTELPQSLEYLIRESRNWFSHSSVRKLEYAELYKDICGVEPPLLIKLSDTRWLSWHNAVSTHLDQYIPLKTLFNNKANDPNPKNCCPTATTLASLHNDSSNLLLLTFLKPILRDLIQINLIFQRTYSDITKAYKDLRIFVFSIAQRVIKPESLRQSVQEGMLRISELQALKNALADKNSLKQLEMVGYGENFRVLSMNMERDGTLSQNKIREIKSFCANFLVRLSKELVERLPDCIQEIEKLRNFAPELVLAKRGRPLFSNLPFNIIPHNFDLDVLESQWNTLGALSLKEVCPLAESFDLVDVVEFWNNCYHLKNGAGEQTLKEISFCVLSLLSLPLSNAVVERIFSLMKIVKTRQRNKLNVNMLNAILFLRLHCKFNSICCTQFEPTEKMLQRFNSKCMYASKSISNEKENLNPEQISDSISFENDNQTIQEVLDLLEESDVNELFK